MLLVKFSLSAFLVFSVSWAAVRTQAEDFPLKIVFTGKVGSKGYFQFKSPQDPLLERAIALEPNHRVGGIELVQIQGTRALLRDSTGQREIYIGSSADMRGALTLFPSKDSVASSVIQYSDPISTVFENLPGNGTDYFVGEGGRFWAATVAEGNEGCAQAQAFGSPQFAEAQKMHEQGNKLVFESNVFPLFMWQAVNVACTLNSGDLSAQGICCPASDDLPSRCVPIMSSNEIRNRIANQKFEHDCKIQNECGQVGRSDFTDYTEGLPCGKDMKGACHHGGCHYCSNDSNPCKERFGSTKVEDGNCEFKNKADGGVCLGYGRCVKGSCELPKNPSVEGQQAYLAQPNGSSCVLERGRIGNVFEGLCRTCDRNSAEKLQGAPKCPASFSWPNATGVRKSCIEPDVCIYSTSATPVEQGSAQPNSSSKH